MFLEIKTDGLSGLGRKRFLPKGWKKMAQSEKDVWLQNWQLNQATKRGNREVRTAAGAAQKLGKGAVLDAEATGITADATISRVLPYGILGAIGLVGFLLARRAAKKPPTKRRRAR